jgi:hypothetical protein
MVTSSLPSAREGATAVAAKHLVEALTHELELLYQFGDALVRQRAAVAASDEPSLQAATHDIASVMATLETCRRTRTASLVAVGAGTDSTLSSLERVLGDPLPPALEDIRRRLRLAAESVSREAGVNRVVLKRAVETGAAFLQQLFSGTEAPETGVAGPTRAPSGALLDRRA